MVPTTKENPRVLKKFKLNMINIIEPSILDMCLIHVKNPHNHCIFIFSEAQIYGFSIRICNKCTDVVFVIVIIKT